MTRFPEVAEKYLPRALSLAPEGRIWAAVEERVEVRQLPAGARVAAWSSNVQRQLVGSSYPTAVAAGRRWAVIGGNSGFVTFLYAVDAQQATAVRETTATIRSVALNNEETLAAAGSDLGELILLRT